MNNVTYGTPKFAGFWIRFIALVIDGIILMIVGWIIDLLFFPATLGIYNFHSYSDFSKAVYASIYLLFIQSIIALLYFVVMNVQKGGTLGKLATNIEIRKADSYAKIDFGTAFGRYFSKILSTIPFNLGYIWAGFDLRKQAWHDKLANTVVIYKDTLQEEVEEVDDDLFDIPEPQTPVKKGPGGLPMKGKPFAQIVFVQGILKGKNLTLKGNRVIFGRKYEEVHVTIKDPEKFVSKIQCEIIAKNGRYYIRNLSSRDTTKLNNKAVNAPLPLKTNDIISFGHFAFKIMFY